jgi:cytochrome b6-f complex iron-sulfur subunit
MSEELSRRRFIEGCAMLVGVSLVGCTSGSSTQTIQVSSTGNDRWKLENVPELKRGEAVAFNFANGEPGLLYKEPAGQLAAVNAKCTHQGCTVEWTDGAQSGAFHCPCHRSDFSLSGEALSGPAKTPLKRYAVKSTEAGIYELSL